LSSNHNSHSSHSKRNVDIVVISDVHLGTAACRATQLLAYLKSINPGKLVLNGDIIDMQQFDHRYWPASHTKVVRRILKFTTIGIPVFYVTGNHEQALRPYSSMLFDFGLLHLVDRLEWTIDGRRTLIVHGDHCDKRLGTHRFIARFSSWAYDRIERFGNLINNCRNRLGWTPVSLTKAIKKHISQATSWIDRFEELCAETAVNEGFSVIVCGHIHQPANKLMPVADERPLYLNSGDWVEHGTALEYHQGKWELVRFEDLFAATHSDALEMDETRAVG